MAAPVTKPKEQLKLVFTGSVGAGKTTAIGTISEVPPIKTEAKPSENWLAGRKPGTTVAMDYGELSLDNDTKLHLLGTPGQRRFDFMSEILCKGAMGLIVLIDNAHQDPFGELDYYLSLNAVFLSRAPAVVGVTHCDISPRPTLSQYCKVLRDRGVCWPVIRADTRRREDVSLLIDSLLATLEYG